MNGHALLHVAGGGQVLFGCLLEQAVLVELVQRESAGDCRARQTCRRA